MGTMVFVLGLAVLFQFVIIRIKWNKGLYADTLVDLAMLIILNMIFGSSILGVVSATAGSTFISLYLIWRPIVLFPDPPVKTVVTVANGISTASTAPDYQAVMNKFDSLFTK